MTNTRAEILGALLLRITLGNKISRVMMYVCKEESGVILLRVSPEGPGTPTGKLPGPDDHVTVKRRTVNRVPLPETDSHASATREDPFPATNENRGRL